MPGGAAPVTTVVQIASRPQTVKAAIVRTFEKALDDLFDGPAPIGRNLEIAVWDVILGVGQKIQTALLAKACWEATIATAPDNEPLRLRLDEDYWLTQTTTLGPVTVPLFAYRDASGKTQVPAREVVFPLQPQCRSSELCLEWETRLGSQLPFRQAEDAMTFFTHGAAPVEDTTISRHLVAIGGSISREWTFRSPDEIRDILANRATRDLESGKPLLYVSTDAHALRRYVDETWKAPWKMINGIRMWCIDQRSGQVVHLGGDYTWGDCHEVAEIFRSMAKEGFLPTDADYGDGVVAQVVMLTDGMPWIRDHIVPETPLGTVLILDFYHAMENVGKYARERFGAGTKLAKSWYERVRKQLLGKRRYRRKKGVKRRGHKKNVRKPRSPGQIHQSENPHGAGEQLARDLIEMDVPEKYDEAHDGLLHYVSENTDRMDYPAFRARGMQIGSGAMESLHRIASQMRLKLAGSRWLPQNALAVLRARMMLLADRWKTFWSRPDLSQQLAQALSTKTEVYAK